MKKLIELNMMRIIQSTERILENSQSSLSLCRALDLATNIVLHVSCFFFISDETKASPFIFFHITNIIAGKKSKHDR